MTIPPIVGRGPERDAIDRLVQAVPDGNGGTLALMGEAGTGKSTLLRYAGKVAHDAGLRVLQVTGVEVESDLAFAGLATLVAQAPEVLAELDDEAQAMLRGALGRGERTPKGLEVHLAALAFVTALGGEPSLVLLDDAQWIDPASLAVLAFAARRLDHDAVAVVIATRPVAGVEITLGGIAVVRLTPLPLSHATDLLAAYGTDAEVAGVVWRATAGNPLAMVEVAESLSPEQRAGVEALPDPLPLAGSVRQALAATLVGLDEDTRRAVAIAAVDASGDVAVVARALRHAGLPAEQLALPGVDLVGVVEGQVCWRHPLARAAVLDALAPEDLRAAHRHVAAGLEATDAGRVAFHLAAAIEGPDDDVADQLEQVAREAQLRGANSAAAEAWSASSLASSEDEARFERLHAALTARWALGDSHGTVARALPLVEATADPLRRSRLALIVGQAITWASGPITGALYLSNEADLVAPVDPLQAGLLEVYASNAHTLANDPAAVVASAQKASAWAEEAGDVGLPVMAAAMESLGRFMLGEAGEARQLLEPLTELCPVLLDAEVDGAAAMSQVVAFSQIVDEQWSNADELLRSLISTARRTGFAGMEAYAHDQLGELDWRRGRWADCASRVAYMLTIGEGTDQPVIHQFRLRRARLDAARGRTAAARPVAETALALGQDLGFASLVLWSREVLALAALADGDTAEALHHHQALAAAWDDRDIHLPGMIWWQAAYIEELVALDRRAEAEDALDRLRIDHKRAGSNRWSLSAVRRGEAALTTNHEAAVTALDDAADALRSLGAPFELALVLLARGERLRAAGRTAEATRDLGEARSRFEHLAARPWADRAAALLGGDAAPAQAALASRLTDAELRVAMSVGSGVTNRQAADDLYLSVKTVDSHLQSIYRKLEIRSRSQLASLVAREQGPGPV